MGKINHDPSVMVYIELNHAPIPHPDFGPLAVGTVVEGGQGHF